MVKKYIFMQAGLLLISSVILPASHTIQEQASHGSKIFYSIPRIYETTRHFTSKAVQEITKSRTLGRIVDQHFPEITLAATSLVLAGSYYALHRCLDSYFKLPTYRPPQEIIDIIEDQKKQTREYSNGVKSVTSHEQTVFIKPLGFDRVVNARRMQRILNQNNISNVVIPKKYLYRYNGSWMVVAESFRPNWDIICGLEVAQSLARVEEETGYGDMHSDNVFPIKSDQVAIIDTENRSFDCAFGVKATDSWMTLFYDYSAREFLVKTTIKRKRNISKSPEFDAKEDHVGTIQKLLFFEKCTKICLGISACALAGCALKRLSEKS